jgi:hypothetical protein
VPTSGIGDLGVSLKATLVPNAHGGLGLAALASGTVPTGDRASFASDHGATGTLRLLAEYTIHNLSDGDFTFSIPAADDAIALIAKLAPDFGFSPMDLNYNTNFRNPVFANISQERILIIYGNGGLAAVRAELDALRARRRF